MNNSGLLSQQPSTHGDPSFDLLHSSSSNLFRPLSTPTYNYDDNTVSADLSEGKIAQVVKRHLAGTSSPSGSLTSNSLSRINTNQSSHYDDTDDPGLVNNAHQLAGGAITHDIYKWAEDQELDQCKRQRSQSVHLPCRQELPDPTLMRLKDPGGFRRHFVVKKAARQGKEPPYWMTRTFVDFLALYGHFGGEDLSEDEDEDYDDDDALLEEGSAAGLRQRYGGDNHEEDETSPLIRKAQENAVRGTATPSKAVFLLLKSFVGTVMFLPKAFFNGGLFFSTALLTVISVISLYTFLLLVETRNKVPASFGDIGGILFGKYMRMAVLIAITFSQVGFVCAYMVFVAQNTQSLIETVSQCEIQVPLSYLIIGQMAIFVPLAMIRKIQKMSAFALVADVFILLGLVYLYYYDFLTLATQGVGNVAWIINAKSFPMFIGTAVFTYEGVGLVIPITESMKEPEKFPRVLSYTMIGITSIFLSVGFFSYLAFGDKVQTVILLNLPNTPAVNIVQALYALAICLSIPLQLFPAIRITENALFATRSGKNNQMVKWQKNVFRCVAVSVCVIVATLAASDLDKFVSLIGSVCCVPLCFLFPPLFHYRAIATTWRQKAIDITILVFGVLSMTYTTGITITLWSEGGTEAPISRCLP
ncbi:transmembrane amino acid transporter protein-domain-containing protein [Chlamydoabsidia padenii]|nr:transmembrane amino acid transporter protein-domain-containing protein [Chlamydoabsidia padenii]